MIFYFSFTCTANFSYSVWCIKTKIHRTFVNIVELLGLTGVETLEIFTPYKGEIFFLSVGFSNNHTFKILSCLS